MDHIVRHDTRSIIVMHPCGPFGRSTHVARALQRQGTSGVHADHVSKRTDVEVNGSMGLSADQHCQLYQQCDAAVPVSPHQL